MSEQEDPRELARKLAEQAKARALAKELAERAKARNTQQNETAVAQRVSLADRAPRPLSAQDALRVALDQERAEEARKLAAAREVAEAAEARKAAEQAARAQAAQVVGTPVTAAPAPTSAQSPAASSAPVALQDPAELVARRIPGAEVIAVTPVGQRDAFRALWTAHRVRAAAEDDIGMLITADVLMDAALRVPAGALVATHVKRGAGEHAVFVDTSTGVLLGITGSPALYLAGL